MKITVNLRQVMYILLLIPFVRLEAFTHIESVSIFYDVTKLLAFFLIIFFEFTIYFRRKIKMDGFLVLILLMYIWCLFTVVLHGTSILSFFVNFVTTMILPLLLDYAFRCSDIHNFLSGAKKYFKGLIIAHFLLLLVYPDGIYQEASRRVNFLHDTAEAVHLLGKANANTPILMAMIVVIILASSVMNEELSRSDKICIILGWISIIVQLSSTGIIGLIIFALLMIYFCAKRKIRDVSKSVNFKFFLMVAILGSVAVCVFSIQNYFAFFIEGVLHKDVTLSNRINVWNMVKSYIISNFNFADYITGTGLFSYSTEIFNGRYAHSHNQFLDIFIKSGIVGVLFYVRLFVISVRNMNAQYKRTWDKEIMVISATIIAFTSMFIAEVYTTPLIMMVLYLGYRYELLSESSYYLLRKDSIYEADQY